uniref:Uncharacterized protein n=1 Tax=Acanthochromis polyacanthus TaxID=80966 RepID=A0A3Q1G5H3_9TELE
RSALKCGFILVYYSIQALDRSETRRDGGYKHNWSFSLSDDSEEERRHDTAVQICLLCKTTACMQILAC